MILDSSAVVAVLSREPEAAEFQRLIATQKAAMSAATYVEAGIVLDRLGRPEKSSYLDRYLKEAKVAIESVTAAQASIARAAYRNYGKGTGHRAQLNFGDCFSYALAIDRDEPLLFKGNDFVFTDVRSVTGGH